MRVHDREPLWPEYEMTAAGGAAAASNPDAQPIPSSLHSTAGAGPAVRHQVLWCPVCEEFVPVRDDKCQQCGGILTVREWR